MKNALTCPKCATDQAVGARFCVACGQPLKHPCPVCHHENPLDSAFCQHCGAEMLSHLPGLGPDRLEVYRRVFTDLGFFDDPTQSNHRSVIASLLGGDGLPEDPNDLANYWVFSKLIGASANILPPWKGSALGANAIDQLEVTGRKFKGKGLLSGDDTLLAFTRCQVIFMNLSKGEILQWPYTYIGQARVSKRMMAGLRGANVHLRFQDGNEMKFHIQPATKRYIGWYVGWLVGLATGSVVASVALQYTLGGDEFRNANPLDICEKFVSEITAVA